ncbi:hypothetical protein AWENTII_010899 [Aspergillus wentii]
MTWTGSCMCSNIKYKVDLPADIEPPKLTLCHCTTCKHYTGSAFSANFCVPKDKHSFTQGTPKVYYGDTDHGRKIKRQFCGDCGSPLTSEPGHLVGKILVKAGTLDADHKLRIGGWDMRFIIIGRIDGCMMLGVTM